MTKKLHLGWSTNFTPPDWESDWASPEVAEWANGKFYVDMARSMERACFDFMMIEDTVMVADAYGGTMEGSLKNAIFAPKQDPIPLAIQVAVNTTHLGVVATMSTSFYPPYLLARLCSTADSIRAGPVRLEHRLLGRGPGGTELRPRRTARARRTLQRWLRSTSTWSTNSGTPGSPTPS